ncbi:MAG: hypothetical protein J6B88_01575 [Clostridia bacterium]|nr:hypothetical protein [Clostridia bacterium]MBO5231290.1 hypothetical protein [Clostridia bacterium]
MKKRIIIVICVLLLVALIIGIVYVVFTKINEKKVVSEFERLAKVELPNSVEILEGAEICKYENESLGVHINMKLLKKDYINIKKQLDLNGIKWKKEIANEMRRNVQKLRIKELGWDGNDYDTYYNITVTNSYGTNTFAKLIIFFSSDGGKTYTLYARLSEPPPGEECWDASEVNDYGY